MTPRPVVCCTFIGEVRHDSRLQRFARTLSARYDVHVVALSGRDEEFDLDGITVHNSGIMADEPLRRRLPAFWRDAVSTALDTAPDVLLASDLYSLPLAARVARLRSLPLHYDSRELYSSVAALQGRPLMQWWWSRVERRYARKAACISTVNESIAAELRKKFPAGRVIVLPNYPDWPEPHPGDGLRKALGIDATKKILLSQGGLQKGRGAFVAIDALALVEGCVLVFLGDGDLREEIRGYAEKRGVTGRVYLPPSVAATELPDLTSSADIGLCLFERMGTSYHLSLPNKLFEYMAAGLPIVASRLPEIVRVIESTGAGLLVDPGSADSVAEGIRRLLSDAALRASIHDACLASKDAYSWRTVAAELLRSVEQSLGG